MANAKKNDEKRAQGSQGAGKTPGCDFHPGKDLSCPRWAPRSRMLDKQRQLHEYC